MNFKCFFCFFGLWAAIPVAIAAAEVNEIAITSAIYEGGIETEALCSFRSDAMCFKTVQVHKAEYSHRSGVIFLYRDNVGAGRTTIDIKDVSAIYTDNGGTVFECRSYTRCVKSRNHVGDEPYYSERFRVPASNAQLANQLREAAFAFNGKRR